MKKPPSPQATFSSELHTKVGSQFEQRGNLALAEQHFLSAIQCNSGEVNKSARPQFRLARLYWIMGRLQEAYDELEAISPTAFRYGPPPHLYFDIKLKVLSGLGRQHEFAATLKKAEEIYGPELFSAFR